MPRSAPRWREVGALLSAAERWLLPGACLLCGGPAAETDPPDDPLVCRGCIGRFSPLPFPQCVRCGQPISPGIACRLCLAWPDGLAGVRSAVWLDGGARRAVHLLKYDGWWRLGEALAVVMQRALPLRREITLVPIPLSAGRERVRGYNQSAKIADALGQRLGVRVRQSLGRGRDTGTQTALTPEARRANLAGAFAATEPAPANPVLVDDVFTTGATLAEAAHALLAAGATSVTGVTFARAVRPLASAQAAQPLR